MKNNGTTKYRLTQLEKRVEKVDESLDLVLQNHLPHINTELSSVKARVTILASINLLVLVVIALLAILLR